MVVSSPVRSVFCLAIVLLVTAVGSSQGQDGNEAAPKIMPGAGYRSRSNKILDRSIRNERLRNVRIPPRSHRVWLSPTENNMVARSDNAPDDSRIVFPDMTRLYNQPPNPLLVDEVISDLDEGIELPEDLDLGKLDIDEMLKMSNIGTIDDFARMFQVELPDPEDTNSIFSDGSFSARFGSAGADTNVKAVSATCRPSEQVVHLGLPFELNVIYFPQCVRLQRCGGCCTGPLLKCRPKQVEPVTLKILRVENTSGSSTRSTRQESPGRGRSSRPSGRRSSNRRRRRQAARYYYVHEENHTACSCKCRVQEEDCVPAIHKYMASECQCRCKNSDEQSKCEPLSSTHYWDTDSCKCYCLKTHDCSTGQYFDHGSCSCVHVLATLPGGSSGVVPRSGIPLDVPTGDSENEGRSRWAPRRIPITFGRPEYLRRRGDV